VTSRGPAADGAILRLESLGKRYRPDGPALFEGLELELRPGEYLAIMGESGVGKSTLLNLLAGLDAPDTGRIWVGGTLLSSLSDDDRTLLRRSSVGFVFQAFHVLPYLSVEQNVSLPLELMGVARAQRVPRIARMLDAVGISALAHRQPRELSGGELQRVAIARALIHEPRLVLADEPTGNLDARTAAATLSVLRSQIKAHAGAGILITHSLTAAQSADRILILDGHGLKPWVPAA
jgi:putative ABC transport system ATP-binding protein